MSFTTETVEWNDLFSSTMEHYVPGRFRQTITDHPVLRILLKNNKERSGMGRDGINFRLSFGDNESVQFIESTRAKFNFSDQSVLTKGRISPSILVGHYLIDQEEREQNSGAEQMASLAEEKMEQLKESFDRKLSRAIFSNGTLDGKPATKGLKYWVPNNPGSLTVANVSETSMAWWKSQARTGAGAWATYGWGGSSANYPLNMYLNCSDGSKKPRLIVSSQGVFEEAHRALMQKVEYNDKTGFGNIGHDDGLPFMAGRWVYDKDAPTGYMWFLNPDYFRFYVSPGMNFTMLPIERIPNQPFLSYQFMTLRHQLVCVRRNLQGVITGWTEPS